MSSDLIFLPLPHHSGPLASPPVSKRLAGEEGFEPPLSVLETDGLPLNLLPFTLSDFREG